MAGTESDGAGDFWLSIAAAADSQKSPAPSDSVPAILTHYQTAINQLRDPSHPLNNRDLDTGYPVQPAGYRLTDDTYATLLHRLVQTPTTPIPPGIKRDILAYYANLELPFATKKDPAAWATLQQDLTTLQTLPTSTDPIPYPTYGDGSGDAPPDTTTPTPAP